MGEITTTIPTSTVRNTLTRGSDGKLKRRPASPKVLTTKQVMIDGVSHTVTVYASEDPLFKPGGIGANKF